MAPISERSEILFLYEVRDANPNGDPMDENKPRVDPETGVATVTDVRLKRTIRDYWFQRKGLEILVRDTYSPEGFLRDGKGRATDFFQAAGVSKQDSVVTIEQKLKQVVLDQCIDVRCFGSTLPFELDKKKSGSLTLTGPVQFSGFNRSLHPVSTQFIQGTAAFASTATSSQKSFREDYILHYACIACYGVVNEIAARDTKMSEADRTLLLEGLWRGTQDLISRSKMGHRPLLLVHIRYKDGFRLGDLAGRVLLRSDLDPHKLRTVRDYQIDVGPMLKALEAQAGHVSKVEYLQDEELTLVRDGEPFSWSDLAVPTTPLLVWDAS